jgi:iron(III) transport system ATP-binding protein
MTSSHYLTIENLSISFSSQIILNNLNLQLHSGEIGCLLGSSGCGKTTLLRAIAGFEKPQLGSIQLNNKQLVSDDMFVLPEKRGIGMVFQDFALFPHLNVEDNIAFGLSKFNRFEKSQRVDEMLKLVNLHDIQKRYPHQLSGGQQQRVALARALASKPELLLMDEPFSSLDVELREQLALDIRNILKKQHISSIMVTHDQQEAFTVADKIGLMTQGRIIQWSTPYELYHQPVNDYVARFIGKGTILPGIVKDSCNIKTVLGNLSGQFDMPSECLTNGCQVKLLIRPDDVIHDDNSELKLQIIEKAFKGDEFIYTLKIDEQHHLLCKAPSHHNHAVNSFLGISMDVRHIIVLKH